MLKLKLLRKFQWNWVHPKNNKIFIITRGRFTKGCESIIKGNITLLDGKALADYLIHFGLIATKDLNPDKK